MLKKVYIESTQRIHTYTHTKTHTVEMKTDVKIFLQSFPGITCLHNKGSNPGANIFGSYSQGLRGGG